MSEFDCLSVADIESAIDQHRDAIKRIDAAMILDQIRRWAASHEQTGSNLHIAKQAALWLATEALSLPTVDTLNHPGFAWHSVNHVEHSPRFVHVNPPQGDVLVLDRDAERLWRGVTGMMSTAILGADRLLAREVLYVERDPMRWEGEFVLREGDGGIVDSTTDFDTELEANRFAAGLADERGWSWHWRGRFWSSDAYALRGMPGKFMMD